jgi:hypothetical protein
MTPYYVIYGLVLSGIPICFIDDGPVRRMAQKVYFTFIAIALVAFAGARGTMVDRDYDNYAIWFHAIASGDATPMQWLRDPTFALLSYATSLFGFSYTAVATLYALLGLISTIFFVLVASAQRWITLYFYLFFCLYYLEGEITLIRSAVAVPLMALSLYLACEEHRRKALAFYILALLFHFSVIIALPFFLMLLAGVKFRSRFWVYSLAAFGVIVSQMMSHVVEMLSGLYRISEYLNAPRTEADLPVLSWYALAHLIAIAFCVLLLWGKLSLHQRVATLLAAFGLCLFQIFIRNTGLATRFIDIFDLYWILVLVAVLEKLNGNRRFVYIAFLIMIGLALFIKSLQYVGPYSTVMNADVLDSAPRLIFAGS